MVLCKKDSNDPLARQLFRDYKLSLVKTARPTSELMPGSIISIDYNAQEALAILHDVKNILDGFSKLDISECEFRVLETVSSGKLDARITAELSPVIGFSNVKQTLMAALTSERSIEIVLKLESPRRQYVSSMSVFDQKIRNAKLTTYGEELLQGGSRLYFVHQVITCHGALISSDRTLSVAVDVLAQSEEVTSGQLQVRKLDKNSRTFLLQRTDVPMVIGFQSAEIVQVNDVLRLKALLKPLDVLGDKRSQNNNSFEINDTLASETIDLFVL
jgi:hypothetical protein